MQGYDWPTCLRTLTQKGFVPVCQNLPNNPYHCDDLVQMDPVMHQQCAEIGVMYFAVPALACVKCQGGVLDPCNAIDFKYFKPNLVYRECTKLGQDWTVINCYCCCSCFAYGTPVEVPDGTRAIELIARGDEVLTGWRGADGELDWRPLGVTFSDGAASQVSHATVYLHYGPAEQPRDLICSSDQVLMLADGGLVTASMLRQGDMLTGGDGKPVEVLAIGMGEYSGGVHHIGTGAARTSDNGTPLVDGHLIVAGGLVAGDFFLQSYWDSIPNQHKADDVDQRHELGTPEYEERHRGAKVRTAVLFGAPPHAGAEPQQGSFRLFTDSTPLPLDTASFLDADQSQDVLANGQQMPLGNNMPKGLVTQIFDGLRGYYPDLTFYLDWYEMLPNVHAVQQYGQNIVVVTGGLARLVGFGYEGLVMAIAHGIQRFSGNPPKGVFGLTGTGAADYFGFGLTSRRIWVGRPWVTYTTTAIKQMESLFELIDDDHKGGNPKDPVNQPSIHCRQGCMESGFGGGDLPECAGGPPPPKIALESVTAPSVARVNVALSLPPTVETGNDPKNFTITPEAPVTAAQIDERSNFLVTLTAELERDTSYELTIHDLESPFGEGVDPEHDEKPFKVEVQT
jgi:Hint domain